MAEGAVEANITNLNARAGAMFDGVDDIVTFTNTASYDSSKPFTISCWVKTKNLASGDNGDIIYKYIGAGDNRSWLLGIQNNHPRFIASPDGTSGALIASLGTSTISSNDTWKHLTGKYDGNKLYIYLNGISDDLTPPTITGIKTGTANIIMGGAPSAGRINGIIADVKYYNRALTDAEILKVYNGQPVTDGLVSRWKLAKDYKDSVGIADGTNSGSILTIADDSVAAAIKADRTTANDKYLITAVKGQIISTVIEEAA